MAQTQVRSTLYLDADLHQALRLKAATTHNSISAIVNEAIREALREDQEDLAAIAERSGGPTMTYQELLEALKADGTL